MNKEMNYWTKLSFEYANQRTYLDDLFAVYPTIPEGIREIDRSAWARIETAFNNKQDTTLLNELLELDLFPIKDSYVAYLKRDPSAANRNPATVARLCSRLYEMGLNEVYKRSSEPKETNRQIGPLFKRWVQKGVLGAKLMDVKEFSSTETNGILNGSDRELLVYAHEHLNYNRDKGLDLVARFNSKLVIGEAKFLTDFGGHQNAQFSDAIETLDTQDVRAVKIAILDGVLYIPGKNKMFRFLCEHPEYNILSTLVLCEFLYQV
jgi:hypothetical protein